MPEYEWKRITNSQSNVNRMVKVGCDHDGKWLVVGRAYLEKAGEWLPAKAKPEGGVACVSWYGSEYQLHDFQVLMKSSGNFEWIDSQHGDIETGAVQAGETSGGEKLYVGKIEYNGVPCIGKVHPSHNSLYIPYAHKEHRFGDYELLVDRNVRD